MVDYMLKETREESNNKELIISCSLSEEIDVHYTYSRRLETSHLLYKAGFKLY